MRADLERLLREEYGAPPLRDPGRLGNGLATLRRYFRQHPARPHPRWRGRGPRYRPERPDDDDDVTTTTEGRTT